MHREKQIDQSTKPPREGATKEMASMTTTKDPLTPEQRRFADSFGLTDDETRARYAEANAEIAAEKAERNAVERNAARIATVASMSHDDRAIARNLGLTDAEFVRRRNDSAAAEFNFNQGR
jgi:hypothetical protein